jgi:hypothetical protein
MDTKSIFHQVIKTIENKKFMIEQREDGIYIRLAGNEEKGEVFTLEWGKVYSLNERLRGHKSHTHSFAKQELDILKATVPDAIVTPFANEILALCEAFGKSGQSGGSAPMTASAISQAVKHLMLQEPICEVTGHEKEWMDITDINSGEPMWQNKRCSGLFKYADNKCSYVDAIIWKGQEKYDTFCGRVYIDEKDFELIGSSQYVRFPFKPKTFYIDTIRVPIKKEEAEERKMHYIEGNFNECYYSVLKDPKQLKQVFKYYDKKD